VLRCRSRRRPLILGIASSVRGWVHAATASPWRRSSTLPRRSLPMGGSTMRCAAGAAMVQRPWWLVRGLCSCREPEGVAAHAQWVGFNTGFGCGGLELLSSWLPAILRLLDAGVPAVFTCPNFVVCLILSVRPQLSPIGVCVVACETGWCATIGGWRRGSRNPFRNPGCPASSCPVGWGHSQLSLCRTPSLPRPGTRSAMLPAKLTSAGRATPWCMPLLTANHSHLRWSQTFAR
jgi:hypothetical protein